MLMELSTAKVKVNEKQPLRGKTFEARHRSVRLNFSYKHIRHGLGTNFDRRTGEQEPRDWDDDVHVVNLPLHLRGGRCGHRPSSTSCSCSTVLLSKLIFPCLNFCPVFISALLSKFLTSSDSLRLNTKGRVLGQKAVCLDKKKGTHC